MHIYLQNSITAFRLGCNKILQNRAHLEEQVCYKGHSPSKTLLSITTLEGVSSVEQMPTAEVAESYNLSTVTQTAMCAEEVTS